MKQNSTTLLIIKPLYTEIQSILTGNKLGFRYKIQKFDALYGESFFLFTI
jgi:hypothetical protein